jgi:hypothetical protein
MPVYGWTLDRIPLWRGNDVPVKQLVDDFATYLYLPRLRDPDVLITAIRESLLLLTWQTETFAYAQSKDTNDRYLGLIAGSAAAVQVEGGSLVVKPEVAAEQQRKDADAARDKAGDTQPGREGSGQTAAVDQRGCLDKPPGGETSKVPAPAVTVYRRFHGAVQLDSLRVGRDAGRISDEVIQHLTKLVGSDVLVTLEIQARLQDGASEKTIRDVTENCRTLRFDSFGFEEE